MLSKSTDYLPAKPSYALLFSEEMKFQVRVSLSVSLFSEKLYLLHPQIDGGAIRKKIIQPNDQDCF